MCPICFDTDPDGMLQLDCKHHVHKECVEGMVRAGWTGKRITFSFISCPECRTPISHPDLQKLLKPHLELQEKVLQLSLEACLKQEIVDGLEKLVKINKDAALNTAANEISCFMCSLCNEPVVGGRKDCAGLERTNVSDFVCNSCQWKRPSAYKCSTHGWDDAIVKCDFCCNIATYTCGSGKYCSYCHQSPYAHTQPLFDPKKGGTRKKGQGQVCPGPKLCPLQVPHPPNGRAHTSFIIGCLHGCKNMDKTDIRSRAVIERTPSFLTSAWEADFENIDSSQDTLASRIRKQNIDYLEKIKSQHDSTKKRDQKYACCVVM